MKEIRTIEYSASMKKGSGYLSERSNTLDGIKRIIDETNKRVVSRGYKAERYVIMREERHKWILDDGTPYKRETLEQMIEVYPKEETPSEQTPSWKDDDFWDHIPEDCRKAISELKRMKVYSCCAWDYEKSFADVWWNVLHEVDMYVEGEFCREASRSHYGSGEPDAMNLSQAKKADVWLIRWIDLFNAYKDTAFFDFSEDEFIYDGQL